MPPREMTDAVGKNNAGAYAELGKALNAARRNGPDAMHRILYDLYGKLGLTAHADCELRGELSRVERAMNKMSPLELYNTEEWLFNHRVVGARLGLDSSRLQTCGCRLKTAYPDSLETAAQWYAEGLRACLDSRWVIANNALTNAIAVLDRLARPDSSKYKPNTYEFRSANGEADARKCVLASAHYLAALSCAEIGDSAGALVHAQESRRWLSSSQRADGVYITEALFVSDRDFTGRRLSFISGLGGCGSYTRYLHEYLGELEKRLSIPSGDNDPGTVDYAAVLKQTQTLMRRAGNRLDGRFEIVRPNCKRYLESLAAKWRSEGIDVGKGPLADFEFAVGLLAEASSAQYPTNELARLADEMVHSYWGRRDTQPAAMAVAWNEKYVSWCFEAASLYRAAGKYESAFQELSPLMKPGRITRDALPFAISAAEQNPSEPCIRTLDQVLGLLSMKRQELPSDRLSRVAEALRREKRFEEAVDWYTLLFKAAGYTASWEALCGNGQALISLGRMDQALSFLNEHGGGARHAALFQLGRTCQSEGKWADATTLYEPIVNEGKGSDLWLSAVYFLSQCAEELGHIEDAARMWRLLVENAGIVAIDLRIGLTPNGYSHIPMKVGVIARDKLQLLRETGSTSGMLPYVDTYVTAYSTQHGLSARESEMLRLAVSGVTHEEMPYKMSGFHAGWTTVSGWEKIEQSILDKTKATSLFEIVRDLRLDLRTASEKAGLESVK